MGCFVRGGKNGMGCFVRGGKNGMGCCVWGGKSMQDVLSGVSKNGMGCFVPGCFVLHSLILYFCLFLLLYVPSQQLWSLRYGQFTFPWALFLGKLEQAVNQYFVHILSLVTGNNPS